MDKRYFIAIVLYAAAGIMVFTFVYPVYQRVRSLERLIAEREDEFSAQNALVKEIGKLRAQQKQMQKETARVFNMLPFFGARSIPELFIELEGLASQSGVLLDAISFASPNKAKGAAGEEKPHKAVDVQFSLKGRYNDLKRFMNAVETNEHLMDGVMLSLSAPLSSEASKEKSNESEEAPGTELFSLKVSLDAYYQ